jgi:glutamyl-tRNA reductase
VIVVVGLSHKTAEIAVRERLALPNDAMTALLDELVAQPEVGEALVVSTCNRVEVVAAGKRHYGTAMADVAAAVARVLGDRAPGVESFLYRHSGESAVQHLFRVVCSLDSLVLGEPQILGQVKSAFHLAKKHGCVGLQLNRAISHALRAAKRVRTQTALGTGQVSVPSAALDLAREIFGNLAGKRVLLIGSGQMGETAARLLVGSGAKLAVMGRNRERVEELATSMQGEAHGFEALEAQLALADVIITATSSPGYVVTHQQVAGARRRRRGRSLFLIDLAVPRDIDPSIDDLDGVFLYNVDDLSEIVAQTLSSRRREAEAAEEIVSAETKSYVRALSAEQATPTIVSLRKQFSAVISGELERSARGLKHLSEDDRQALARLVEASVNKLLHPATRQLRALAADPEAQSELDAAVALLRDVFSLPIESTTGLAAPDALRSSPLNVPPNALLEVVSQGQTEPSAVASLEPALPGEGDTKGPARGVKVG